MYDKEKQLLLKYLLVEIIDHEQLFIRNVRWAKTRKTYLKGGLKRDHIKGIKKMLINNHLAY